MANTSCADAAAAVAAADPPVLARRRAGRPAGGQRADAAPRRRPAARAGLSGRRQRGASPAATSCRPARRCRRCCSTTTRRSPSRSGCARRPAAPSPASRRRRYGRWPRSMQVLPPRLRRRVDALQARTRSPAMLRRRPDRRRDRADRDRAGLPRRRAAALRVHRRATASRPTRLVEPHRLVSLGRRWYLVAWDLDRGDWRSFRVDRLRGAGVDRRAVPAARAARRRRRPRSSGPKLAQVPRRYQVEVRFRADAAEGGAGAGLRRRGRRPIDGTMRVPDGGRHAGLAGGDRRMVGADFEIVGPPELRDWCARSAPGSWRPPPPVRGGDPLRSAMPTRVTW